MDDHVHSDDTDSDTASSGSQPMTPTSPVSRLPEGKTYAEDPRMRSKFRRATFAVGGLQPASSGKHLGSKGKSFMTEDECLEMENEGVDPKQYILDEIRKGCTSLDMGHMRLTTVPEEILGFGDQLEVFTARKNAITELPQDFGVLFGLKRIDLQCNRLMSIPASIAMLEHLTYLDLSNNQIHHIPDECEDLVCLTTVILDFNYLESFPAVFLKIRSVEKLYVVENAGIQSLPPAEAFQSIGSKLLIHMDNTPEIAQQWDVLKATLPSPVPTMQWNKIWPDKVIDGLYIGSLRAAQNKQVFTGLTITAVVTCGRNLHTNLPPGVQQMVLDVDDNDEEKLSAHFHRAINFMNGAMKDGAVLVHCFAGVSRSATIVIAYIMQMQKKSFSEAINFVREQRPAVNPNPNFCRQLQEFEEECLN